MHFRGLASIAMVGGLIVTGASVGAPGAHASSDSPACGPLLDGVHQVSTAAHLENVGSGGATSPCALNDDYLVVENIDLSDSGAWTPIGTAANPFTGGFDGGNLAISGLNLDSDGGKLLNQGLFGVLGTAGDISNVKLVDVSLDTAGERDSLGALVGLMTDATVSNSSAEGTISVSSDSVHVGGLVGEVNDGVVRSSSADVNLTGGGEIGGLIGRAAEVTISQAHATGAVDGEDSAGGLIGRISSSTVLSNSYATGSVRGGVYVGGLIGFISGSTTPTTVDRSFSTGNVNGFNTVGGFIGYAEGGTEVRNTYARGEVEGRRGINAGGLLGIAQFSSVNGVSRGPVLIEDSYATGAIRVETESAGDPSTAGGLVGKSSADGALEVNDSFWDTEQSGLTASAGGTGKTTEEMTSFATYANTRTEGLSAAWGIVNGWAASDPDGTPPRVWGICSPTNDAYPFLLWEEPANPCPVVEKARSAPVSSPGIFLSVQAAVGDQAAGTRVEIGSYAAASSAPFLLTVRSSDANSPQRVLGRGAASVAGHLEQRVSLPALPEGVHTVVFVSQDVRGNVLTLANRITVGASGELASITPERLQPEIR